MSPVPDGGDRAQVPWVLSEVFSRRPLIPILKPVQNVRGIAVQQRVDRLVDLKLGIVLSVPRVVVVVEENKSPWR